MIKPFWLPQKFCQRTLGMAVVKVFMLQVQGFYRQGNFPVMLCTSMQVAQVFALFQQNDSFCKITTPLYSKKRFQF